MSITTKSQHQMWVLSVNTIWPQCRSINANGRVRDTSDMSSWLHCSCSCHGNHARENCMQWQSPLTSPYVYPALYNQRLNTHSVACTCATVNSYLGCWADTSKVPGWCIGNKETQCWMMFWKFGHFILIHKICNWSCIIE